MASTPDKLYITYVDVDRELLRIWGQRSRLGASYIEKQLAQLLPELNRTPPPNPAEIYPGYFCFAKYSDDNFYRARVLSRVHGNSVSVVFVDYGNRDIVNLSNIRKPEKNEGDMLVKMSEQAEEYYLGKVSAPANGWTKEIVSEIRRYICYEELPYEIITLEEDIKILELQFHNEDFANFLVKKQLASHMSLPVQRKMILSYCNVIPGDNPLENNGRVMPRVSSLPTVPPANRRIITKTSNSGSDVRFMPQGKGNSPVEFSHPVPPRQLNSPFPHLNQNIPKNPYFSPGGQIGQVPITHSAPTIPVNPYMGNVNPMHLKENEPFANSKGIIQLLPQQVKQYIAEDDAKNQYEAEKFSHHYVNTVLEVGNTYNVVVSFIDDGPWSFSIQLLTSEAELRKLMDDLASTELTPIKPPIILGHPCIASSILYGNLCRGVIVSVSHSAVKVYFVDFGNTEDLPYSSIFELPPKFFKTRVLSQKFSLSGLQKVTYSDDIKKFFKEVVQDEYLMLRVVSLEDENLPTCELFLKNINIKRIVNEKIREMKSNCQEDFPKSDDTELVVVTWVVSLQKFFVQLSKRDADLKALKAELSEVEKKGQPLTYQQLSVGFRCVCLYNSDKNWYRAVITSVDSEKAITVFYVDYGNSETVNISCLRRMEGSGLINQLSNQAIQCSLKGFEDKPFDKCLTNKFEALVLEKEIQMSIVSSESQLLCVRLNTNGIDISEILLSVESQKSDLSEKSFSRENDAVVFSKPAESNWAETQSDTNSVEIKDYQEKKDGRNLQTSNNRQGNQKIRSSKNIENGNFQPETKFSKKRFDSKENRRNDQKFDSWNPRGGKQDRDQNSHWSASKPPRRNKEINETDKFEKNRGPKDNKSRDGRFNPRDGNFRERKKVEENRGGAGDGRFNGKEEKPLDSNKKSFVSNAGDARKKNFDTNEKLSDFAQERPRKLMRKEDIAPPGSKYEELSVDIGDSERGIVTYYFSPDEFFVQLLTHENEFRKMMNDIQVYYSDKQPIRGPLRKGDIVIAQFSLDKVLYRAEVVKPTPLTVLYVDYGNLEPVSPDKTWLVDKQFLTLPKQVIKCRLSNILPKEKFWPPPGGDIDKFFEKAEFKCSILKKENDFYEVALTDPETDKDVANEIVEAGLGRFAPPELNVNEIDFSLLPNQILKLYVSHVESPSKFYVNLNAKGLEIIDNEIKRLSQDKNNIIPMKEDSIKPEMLCLIKCDDEVWRRGKITKTNEEVTTVWLCDKGETVELSSEKLMSLPEYLQDFQPQAVQCSLHDDFNIEDGKFKELVEHKQHLIFIVSLIDKRLSVVLYDEDGQKLSFQNNEYPHSIDPISHLPIISQKVPVIIAHIEAPKSIYIQLLSNSQELDNLSEEMTSFYSEDREGFEIEDEGVEGSLVAAKSVVYNLWYRGRLVSSSENNHLVLFIDFGNKEMIPKSNVKKLDPSFLNLCALAKKMALDVEFEAENTGEIEKKILEFCETNDPLGYFKRIGTELISEFVVDEKRMSHVLKSAGLVKCNEVDSFQDVFGGEKNQETEVVDKISVNSETASVDDIEKPVMDSDLEMVYIIYSHGPDDFYVQRETSTDDLNKIRERLSDTSTFENPSFTDMYRLYAAKFSDDGAWYRARVIDNQKEEIEVLFIDYGNKSIAEEIKVLPEDIADIPDLAERCCLVYGDKNDSWSEAACEKFAEYSDGRCLRMKVEAKRKNKSFVKLFNESHTNITEELETLCESDNREEVFVTHVESPDEFFIQYVNDEKSKFITEKLASEECEELLEKNPGTLCQALFDLNFWYRAQIRKEVDNGWEVVFIDFGNVHVSTALKKLPKDIENIPPRAIKCSLDLADRSLYDRVKKEFKELTNDDVIFKASLIYSGELNVVSLKLNGILLEEMFNADVTTIKDFSPKSFETDDGKNLQKNLTDNYLSLNDSNKIGNETDEEKRVRFGANEDGFKSDNEKSQNSNKSIEFSNSSESMENNVGEDKIKGNHSETVRAVTNSNSTSHNKVESSINNPTEEGHSDNKKFQNKTVSLEEESVKDSFESFSYQKQDVSQESVPESISSGVSLEIAETEDSFSENSTENEVNKSATSTSESNNGETHLNDSNSGSTGTSLECNPSVVKTQKHDKIIPGAANGTNIY